VENADTIPKSGYKLTYTSPTAAAGYAVKNDAAQQGSSGVRHFYSDPTLVIRQNSSAIATSGDPAI
jgi:hypothetical protein